MTSPPYCSEHGRYIGESCPRCRVDARGAASAPVYTQPEPAPVYTEPVTPVYTPARAPVYTPKPKAAKGSVYTSKVKAAKRPARVRASPKVHVMISLTREQLALIDEQAKAAGRTRSEHIAALAVLG
jgi:Ribbon-helix-helix protein, copG family